MTEPRIIYEDNHLMIVEKPAGWLSQPDGRPRPDILAWAKAYRNKPGRAFVGLAHRLDLPVGGVLALAKTSKCAERLSRQFRERTVSKIYWALVMGSPSGDEGRLEQKLFRDGDFTRAARPRENGTNALLYWKILRRNDTFSLLEVDLKTGFKHQIRAQLASLGTPVLWDVRYGGAAPPPGQADIGLWARALSLDHPTTKARLTFESEPPATWPFHNAQ